MKSITALVVAVIFHIGASAGYFFNLHTSRLHSLVNLANNTVERRMQA